MIFTVFSYLPELFLYCAIARGLRTLTHIFRGERQVKREKKFIVAKMHLIVGAKIQSVFVSAPMKRLMFITY